MRISVPVLLFVALAFAPFSASAATLSVSPSAASFSEGQRVVINIQVSSAVAMNAASGVLMFPADLLSVDYVNKGSVLNFWVTEPSYSNSAGTVKFEGVSLAGFQGNNGSVLTVVFRAKKAGTAQVRFQAGQVLANDGQGTDITSSMSGGTFTITPGAPKSEPEPEPELEEAIPEPEPRVVQDTKLVPPHITLGTEQGVPAIIGESQYAKADVLLSFTSGGGSKIFITGTTDGEGGFLILVPNALRSGSYHVTAVVVPNGAPTDASLPILVSVGGVVSVDLGWDELLYLGLLVALCLAAVIYSVYRLRSKKPIHSRAARETKEAHTVLRKSFALLRQDLRTYMKDRRQAKGDSAEDLESISEDLDQAEEIIDKEIDDIDSSLRA